MAFTAAAAPLDLLARVAEPDPEPGYIKARGDEDLSPDTYALRSDWKREPGYIKARSDEDLSPDTYALRSDWKREPGYI